MYHSFPANILNCWSITQNNRILQKIQVTNGAVSWKSAFIATFVSLQNTLIALHLSHIKLSKNVNNFYLPKEIWDMIIMNFKIIIDKYIYLENYYNPWAYGRYNRDYYNEFDDIKVGIYPYKTESNKKWLNTSLLIGGEWFVGLNILSRNQRLQHKSIKTDNIIPIKSKCDKKYSSRLEDIIIPRKFEHIDELAYTLPLKIKNKFHKQRKSKKKYSKEIHCVRKNQFNEDYSNETILNSIEYAYEIELDAQRFICDSDSDSDYDYYCGRYDSDYEEYNYRYGGYIY